MLINITKSIDTEDLKESLEDLSIKSITDYQDSVMQETIQCIDYLVNKIEQLNKENKNLYETIEVNRKRNVKLYNQYEKYKNAFLKANKAKNTISKTLNEQINFLQNRILHKTNNTYGINLNLFSCFKRFDKNNKDCSICPIQMYCKLESGEQVKIKDDSFFVS